MTIFKVIGNWLKIVNCKLRIMNIVNKDQALEYLKTGKTVVFPTETSYGLGCDATNQEAVDEVFKIKGRKADKPLLVVVPTVEMAREYLEWNDLLEKLSKLWPGALTVVGEYQHPPLTPHLLKGGKARQGQGGILANGVVSQENTVAVRVTSAEIPKYLSEKLGRPVVATSANISDTGDVYDSAELIKIYAGQEFQPDAIIDAGILPPNPPTTIVSVVGGEMKVLRQGELKVD